MGYVVEGASEEYRELVLELFLIALESLGEDSVYDFGASVVPARMVELAESVQEYKEFWQAPPTDAVFFHRKLGGMFMLANRMQARVNIHQLIQQWL